jgi:hypothetical protein
MIKNDNSTEGETMKAKVKQTTQFGDVRYGYEAVLHTANVTDEFWESLEAKGYTFNFYDEQSDDRGYDEICSIHAEGYSTKAEFMKAAKWDIKQAVTS